MKKSNFTIPNILSGLRLVLVAVFVVFYLTDRKTLAFATMAVSCLSDSLDGWIARRFDQITDLGKVLDPIADKLFTVVTILCLCIGNVLPWWLLAVIAVKEGAMMIGGTIFMRLTKRVLASRWYGKVTTALVFMTMTFSMILDAAGLFDASNPLGAAESYILTVKTAITVACAVCCALEVFSFAMYMSAAIKIYKETKSQPEELK